MASDIDVANTLKVTNGSVILQSGLTLSVENGYSCQSRNIDPGKQCHFVTITLSRAKF
jgi:hypothetical protein